MTDPENTPPDVPRQAGGRWAKGASPNPGGRSKLQEELMALMREKAPRAIERVVEIMEQTEDTKAALQASNSILDRVLGKARESVEVSGDGLSDLLRALVVAKPPPKE